MDRIKAMLSSIGINPNGYAKLRNGITGELLTCEIYMGLVHVQALRHQPEDKIAIRNRGARTAQTREPIKGRQVGGGIRFGEMESDTLISNGAAATVHERLCTVADKYEMGVCKQCGSTAKFNPVHNAFECQICNAKQIGRLTVPYVLKYQKDILAVMGTKLTFGFDKIERMDIDEEELGEEEEEEDESEE